MVRVIFVRKTIVDKLKRTCRHSKFCFPFHTHPLTHHNDRLLSSFFISIKENIEALRCFYTFAITEALKRETWRARKNHNNLFRALSCPRRLGAGSGKLVSPQGLVPLTTEVEPGIFVISINNGTGQKSVSFGILPRYIGKKDDCAV